MCAYLIWHQNSQFNPFNFFYMCGCFSCMYVCVPCSCMVYKKSRRRCQIWGWSYSWLQAWRVHARYEPVTCGRAASSLNFWVISVDLIDQYSLTSHFSCPVHSIEKFCTSEISSCVLESRTQFIYFQYLLSVAFWKFKNVHWLSCSISLSANKLSKYIKGYILFFRLTVVVLPTFNIFHFLLGFLRFLLT